MHVEGDIVKRKSGFPVSSDMNSFQVAQYAATLENYNKAIQIYEQVNDQLTSNV